MPNLPTNPTKTDILETHWYEFLQHQKTELDKRKASGWGVPNVEITEEAFWNWYITEKMDTSHV